MLGTADSKRFHKLPITEEIYRRETGDFSEYVRYNGFIEKT